MNLYENMSATCQDIVDDLAEHLCDADCLGPEETMEYMFAWAREKYFHIVVRDTTTPLGKMLSIRDNEEDENPVITMQLVEDGAEILAISYLSDDREDPDSKNEEYLQDLDEVAIYLSSV